MGDGRNKRRTVRLALGALAASLLVVVAPAQGSAGQVPDGSSADRAAASCWEIIQGHPGSPSGGYWLQTPELIAPQQFYCDMETDGGGWLMVGRGRQGWDWRYTGQGNPASLVSAPSGPSAFSPVTLPSETVDALLGGQRLDSLPDGIRLNRARTNDGNQWQRVDLKPLNRATWTWSFGAGIRTSQTTIDNRSWGPSTTLNWAADSYYNRLNTTDLASKGYLMGFGYGPYVYGGSGAGDYLWMRTNEGYATPFTQVFIRPRVTSPDFGQIPEGGLPASAQRPMMANTTTAVSQPWGVTGRVGVNPTDKSEANMEVQDIAFIGGTAYVGGMFEFVQKGANPAPGEKIRQPYLAAFDINTGAWKSDFRPELNGSVWSLAALPDGRLVVGGDFTSASGQQNTSHLVALNPQTGAVDPTWSANAYVAADGSGRVRALDVQGDWLYVGGRFNRLGGGSNLTAPLTLSNLGRVGVADGTADPTWKPHMDSGPYELDASAAGDRVYLVGNFSRVNFTPQARVAAVNTTDGALVPGLVLQPSTNGSQPTAATYQQTVLEVGDNVFIGGAEHILTRYNRTDFAAGKSVITKNGGDFQALAEKDGVLYGACHCGHSQYWDSRSFSSPHTDAADVTSILFIGAWDARTGEPLPQFQPQQLETRNGSGPWAMRVDPNGCLWFGGDFTRGARQANGSWQWLGGFGKLCPRDATAPTAPSGLTATETPDGVQLTWTAGTDESGPVQYEVLRNDRVIATTWGTGYTDTSAQLPADYWVRSIDRSLNRSATTPAAHVQAPDTTAPGQVTGLTATETTGRSVTLSWQPAQDDRGVTGYDVLRDGTVLATGVTGTGHTDSTVTPGTAYSYQVLARDAAGNAGPASEPLAVTTPGGVQTVATETFEGPDAATWPAQWAPAMQQGAAEVAANAGRLTVQNVPGAAARVALTDQARTDSEVLFSWQPDQAGAGTYLSVYLRGSGGWANAYRPRNGYGVQLAPNSTQVQVQRTVNGATSTIATLNRAPGSGRQWVRFQVVGSTVQVRTWADGEAEPLEWAASVTDPSVTSPGQLHLALSRAGTATAARSVTLDDITLTEHTH